MHVQRGRVIDAQIAAHGVGHRKARQHGTDAVTQTDRCQLMRESLLRRREASEATGVSKALGTRSRGIARVNSMR